MQDSQLATVDNQEQNNLPAVVSNQSLISNEMIFTIQLLAPIYYHARSYGYASEAQAAMVMLKAVGLGFPPTSAPDIFDIMPDGKPALRTKGANALIQRSGIIRVEVEDGKDYCRVTMTRLDNGYSESIKYTDEEAKESRLIKDGKDNSAWSRFPVDMRYNRAFARCARRVAPDIIGGMPLTAELEELRESRSQLPKPSECDHFAAVQGDVTCPTCGAKL
jgi:hypothetical protein